MKYTIDSQILSNLGGGPVPFKDTSCVWAQNIMCWGTETKKYRNKETKKLCEN